VVVIRNQVLEPAQFAVFAERFGSLQVNVRAEANSGATPQVFYVSNVSRDGKPLGSHDAGRYWHSDLCYLERPSYVTLLNAIEVPTRDGVTYGDTEFADMSAAYQALPSALKQELEGLRGANSYRFMWQRKAQEFGQREVLSEEQLLKFPQDALHPIVRTHPRTGRSCLYLCDGYTHRIEGLSAQRSESLLRELFTHIEKPEFRYRHRWQPGDLLIWDNCAVQHRATFDYHASMRRVMQRCCVEGSVPY
jgi:taurine dioxygenase